MLEQLKWHTFVLTPHLLSPLPLNQGDCQNELSLISFGTFNAGMFGTTKSSESISFLKWWGNWVLDPRHMIISYGYDQVWLNYVPVYCPNFFILREKNYNVAYWNLIERELNQRNGFFFCENEPLVAFHFSGFDDNIPEKLTTYPSYEFTNNKITKLLCTEIAKSWINCGRDQFLQLGYKYNNWTDGVAIKESERECFKNNWDILDSNFSFRTSEYRKKLHILLKEAQPVAFKCISKRNSNLSKILTIFSRMVFNFFKKRFHMC